MVAFLRGARAVSLFVQLHPSRSPRTPRATTTDPPRYSIGASFTAMTAISIMTPLAKRTKRMSNARESENDRGTEHASEVFIFHERRRTHRLLFFLAVRNSLLLRHGLLIAKDSYWRDQGQLRFDPDGAL